MATDDYIKMTYSVSLEVAKSAEDVFKHLLQLHKWWPEDFEGDELQPGSEFVFTSGASHYSKNKVIEFIPNQKLAWLTTAAFRSTDGYDWTGTKMIFELTTKGENTVITFIYDGVVLKEEYERLVMICNKTIKEWFFNFISNGDKNIQSPTPAP